MIYGNHQSILLCFKFKQQCKSKRSTSYKLSWWYCFQFSAAPLLASFKRKTHILEEMWELEIFSPFVFCDSGELRRALWFHFRQWIAGLQILTASKTLAPFLFLVAENLPFPFSFPFIFYRNSSKTQVKIEVFLLKKNSKSVLKFAQTILLSFVTLRRKGKGN